MAAETLSRPLDSLVGTVRDGVRAIGIVAVAAACALAFSCRQIVGIGESPAKELTATACGLPYGTTECAACASASCCAESNACADSPTCSAYESCLGACNGDPKCRSQCTIDHKAGTASEVSALSACLTSKCERACNLECGAFAGYITEPASADACQSCLTTNACHETSACAGSLECDAYWRCDLACPTADCKSACALEHPTGAELFAALLQQYQGICSNDCAFGSYWACVGDVTWPSVKGPSIDLTLQITDYASGLPVANADVAICQNCPCGQAPNAVLAEQPSNANGVVELLVPQHVNSADVGLKGCAQITASGYVPTFGYWGFPFSERKFSQLTGPGSSATNAQSFGAKIVTVAAWQAYLTNLGAWPDSGSPAQIAAIVHDCLGYTSPNVRVTTNVPVMSTVYLVSDGGTDQSGFAFIQNPPSGFVTLTAIPESLGRPSSVVTVKVQPNTITETLMYPTPLPP